MSSVGGGWSSLLFFQYKRTTLHVCLSREVRTRHVGNYDIKIISTLSFVDKCKGVGMSEYIFTTSSAYKKCKWYSKDRN